MSLKHIDPEAMYEAIAPLLAKMAKRMQGVPLDFAEANFADAAAEWAVDLAKMMVPIESAQAALDTLSRTSKFFPSYADIMDEAVGSDWKSRKLHFKVPEVLWEEVTDLSSGRVVEVYPCVYPGSRLLSRLDLRKAQVPDYEAELDSIRRHFADGSVAKQEAEAASKRLGYPVRGGKLALERKPNFWGQHGGQRVQEEDTRAFVARSDMKEQIARLRAMR